MGLLQRMIRPLGDESVPDGEESVASDPPRAAGAALSPGPSAGVGTLGGSPPRITATPWPGWPSDWATPAWNSGYAPMLSDTAWACLDLNASVLASMPPYLVSASPSLDAGWMNNPNPDIYTSWEEFAKQLFWDFQAVGEVFVLATGRYASGWPARFHVVPPWTVNVEMGQDGLRSYQIGSVPVSREDLLHVRYQSSVADAHGHSPLEVGAPRMVAETVLSRYAQQFAASGGVPASILQHPEELTAEQSQALQAQWVQARQSSLGEPAVLSGGVTYETIQVSPKDASLVELQQLAASRIAILLGVPPFLVGLPSGGDPMTYANVTAIFDYHWRAGLRPKAQTVMGALSHWLLPRGTSVELNRDAYVQPEPLARAQTAQILHGITDPQGNPALTVEEIRAAERLHVAGVAGMAPPEGAMASG